MDYTRYREVRNDIKKFLILLWFVRSIYNLASFGFSRAKALATILACVPDLFMLENFDASLDLDVKYFKVSFDFLSNLN